MSPVPSPDDARPVSPLYRAVWRWHFLAGLLCLPFLVLLAGTGALYLFQDEIEGLVYRDRLFVAPAAQATLTAEQLLARATGPGERAIRYVPAAAPDRSVEVGVERQGRRLAVYLDPYTGRKLGEIADDTRLMQVVKELHSLTLAGRYANYWVEIVAGWAIVLVASGTYLWWPRGRGGVARLRGRLGARLWWRDLHAVTGAFAGAVILFLAVTGMPWSAFWGQQFSALAHRLGQGLPAYVWGPAPRSEIPMGAQGPVPWTLTKAPLPLSSPPAAAPASIGLDHALATFKQLGLPDGYRVNLPADAQGVYSALRFPDDVRQVRVIHLDQYSGAPLVDVGYADYGAMAKATEWGVSLHTGRQFGRANQLLMLAGCLALIGLAASSVVMWWKRRPRGRVGVPARQDGERIAGGALAIAIVLGLLYPLLGATMLLAAAIEYGLARAKLS